jgi:SAM-dependent methyltransferase
LEDIARHYGIGGVLDAILAGLRAEGKDPERLEPDDLAPVDELHMRGREATVELAALAGLRPDLRVLDVGSGLGGSSRYLAGRHQCRTTGIDLTPEYCEIAADLSRRCGLSALTDFRCGSALDMPFEDGSFDLAWTQHVQMNIEDKPRLYAEILRVLRTGGRFAFHDVLAGPGGPPHFPVHWAEEPSMSFLIAPEDLRKLLRSTGFREVAWRDRTDVSREWFLRGVQERKAGPPPNLGLHLILGPTGPQKVQNIARCLQERRITLFQGVFEK